MKARTIITTIVLLAAIASGLWLRQFHSPRRHVGPLSEATAIDRGARTMTLSELDSILGEQFDMVTNIAGLPKSVEKSFCAVESCNFEGVKFDMVNPGADMSTDAIIPGVPNKRLRFAALNDHAAVVFYDWGGFVGQQCVVVLDFRSRTSWGASLTTYGAKTFDQLRSAISNRQFAQWRPGDRA